MRQCQTVTGPLPRLWLISDARNDAGLERALAQLPRGSGFVFRHYHLKKSERLARFAQLAALARARHHYVILAGSARQARKWGADGAYGSAASLGAPLAPTGRTSRALRLVTAHSLAEIAAAHWAHASAILLSPVFATRSHPGAANIGPLRFHSLARMSRVPVIALGGMTPRNAQRLGVTQWAAIDGLVRMPSAE